MSEEAHTHRAQANIHDFYQNFVKSCQTLDSLLLQRLLYTHRRLLDFCQIYLMLYSVAFPLMVFLWNLEKSKEFFLATTTNTNLCRSRKI